MALLTSDKKYELDVLCFGEAIVDFFPEAPGTPLVDVEVFRRHLGGAPANVAVGLARHGVRAGLMTMVGPDDFGKFIKKRLAAEGVDVATVGTHASAKTAVTFVAVGSRGERSFMFFRHPSADQAMAPADVDPARIASSRVFHFGSSTLSREPGRAATLAAFEAAAASGCILSTDPNLRRHLWERPDDAPPILRGLLARCDLVKVSDDEILALTSTADPRAAAAALRDLGASVVIVTLGAEGCWYDAPAGKGMVPGEPAIAVDCTGAGDAFVAGVLSALQPRFSAGLRPADLDEKTIRDACIRGNQLGARAVTALGATTSV